MKPFLLSIYVILICYSIAVSQHSGYDTYHTHINKAETYFFLEQNVDSSLFYYDETFDLFEFIFVKDLLNAAQIAYYSNKPFEKYIVRGFDFGLKPEHLYQIKLFEAFSRDLPKNQNLQEEYITRRSEYLRKINSDYRLYVSKLYISDQINKNKSNYEILKRHQMDQIIERITLWGFPGPKLIGIDDKTIFAELGKPQFDMDSLKLEYSNQLNYLSLDENILSSKMIMIILVHNQCAYLKLQKLLPDLIKNGEIHPREAGLIYDNMFRDINTKAYECQTPSKIEGLFQLNLFCNYKQLNCSDQQTNTLRRQWNIVPLSVDRAKKEYEKQFGFKLFHGFWDCM